VAVRRLGLSNPSQNSNTLIFTSTASYLASFIATNKGGTTQTVRTWVVPAGATLSSQYSYILYDIEVPSANSIESHRFAIQNGDTVYVRASSNDISFSLNGIYDSTASFDSHLTQTTNVHGIADTSQLATLATTNSLNTRLISIELGLGIFD
jgi:hypothetical protein